VGFIQIEQGETNMMYGNKCPKCGLMQLPSPNCKSCGALLGGSKKSSTPKGPLGFEPLPSISDPEPLVLTEETAHEEKTHAEATPNEDWAESAHTLCFYGSGGSLFGIYAVNIFLTLVTVGLYYFWGKVKVRKYLLEQTELEGDRFSFHGTGKELLFGVFKALVVLAGPLALLNFMPLFDAPVIVKTTGVILAYCILGIFVPIAIIGTRRYRLSRTSWRGIRFSFRGSILQFLKIFIGGSLLTVVTLGLYYPFFVTQKQRYLVSHSYYGNQKFEFDGKGKELFLPFLLALLLTVPTLGIYLHWFQARKQRFFWGHTSFGSIRFRSTVTGRNLLGFQSANAILLILTLGLAWPWVVVRKIHFTFRYLTLEGQLDLNTIQQDAQAASATGEGLASFMNAGFDLT
jgi:uncharacterized membrane protein YjgN (DUF898 family)